MVDNHHTLSKRTLPEVGDWTSVGQTIVKYIKGEYNL